MGQILDPSFRVRQENVLIQFVSDFDLAGDTIGCGIDFGTKRAFYTKNGEFLGMLSYQMKYLYSLFSFFQIMHLRT